MLETRRRITETLGFDSIVCKPELVTSQEVTADLAASGYTSVDIYEKYREHINSHRGGWIAALLDTGTAVEYDFIRQDEANVSKYISCYNAISGEKNIYVPKNILLQTEIINGTTITQVHVNTNEMPDSGKIVLVLLGEVYATLTYTSKDITGYYLNLSTSYTATRTFNVGTRVRYKVTFEANETKRCIIFNHDNPITSLTIEGVMKWIYFGKDITVIQGYYGATLEYIHAEDRNILNEIVYFPQGRLRGTLTLGNNIKRIGKLENNYLSGDLYIPKSLEVLTENCFGGNTFSTIQAVNTLDQSPYCPVYSDIVYCNNVYTTNTTIWQTRPYGNNLVAINGAKNSSNALDILTDTIIVGTSCFESNNLRYLSDGEYTLPNTITDIKARAFYFCTGFSGILNFGNSIKNIQTYAFYNCSNLSNNDISFPSGLLTIGSNAFDGCINLTGSLTFPDSATSIGEYAFRNCPKLGYNPYLDIYDGVLTIGSGMLLIGEKAFSVIGASCNFMSVVSTSITCPAYDNAIYSPNGTEFMCIYGAKQYVGTLTLLNNVTLIGEAAFLENKRTGTINILNTVKKIHEVSFYKCYNITGLTFEATPIITEIRGSAFYYCTSLAGNLTIPDSVTTIGISAFSGCGQAAASTYILTLGSSLLSILDNAFRNCTKISTITWNGTPSITTIGAMAFGGMASLTGTFNIPASITSLGANTSNIIGGSGNVTISNLSSAYVVTDNIIYTADYKKMIGTCVNTGAVPTINPACTYICGYALYNIQYTGSLKIHSNITYIGVLALTGMSAITYLKFYRTTAPTYAFSSELANHTGIINKGYAITGSSGYTTTFYTSTTVGLGITGAHLVADEAALDAL